LGYARYICRIFYVPLLFILATFAYSGTGYSGKRCTTEKKVIPHMKVSLKCRTKKFFYSVRKNSGWIFIKHEFD